MTCPKCGGKGTIDFYAYDSLCGYEIFEEKCQECNGKGKVND